MVCGERGGFSSHLERHPSGVSRHHTANVASEVRKYTNQSAPVRL